MIPYIVSISSRFDMSDVKRKHGPEVLELLEKQVKRVQATCGKCLRLDVYMKRVSQSPLLMSRL
jgi:hypothetical protein